MNPSSVPCLPFGAVVFDMDGLLLDSERPVLQAWVQAAREFGSPIEPATFLQVLGRGGEDGRAAFRALLGTDFPYAEARLRVQALIAETREREGQIVKPGARALLERLKAQRLRCGIASSTGCDEVQARLGRAGLLDFFDSFASGEEVAAGKPAPDVYLLAAERLGVRAADCIAFEDSEHGARSALAAGMAVVIVPDLLHPSEAVRGECLAVLPTLCAVAQHHDAWFGGPA